MKVSIAAIAMLGALACFSVLAPGQSLVLSPQPIKRDLMYRILFREVAAYQKQAEFVASRGKPSSFLANYHRNALGLSASQAEKLVQIALPCVDRIEAIDSQAAALIGAIKAQHKDKTQRASAELVPQPPAELAILEARRAAIILDAADSIVAAFGPAQFAFFETNVRRYVGSNFRASAAPALKAR